MKKGVTLIALVVTIVILFILAAITIGMLIGERSLISRAREGSDKTKLVEIVERMDLASSNIFLEIKSAMITTENAEDESFIRNKMIEFNTIDSSLIDADSFKKIEDGIYNFEYKDPDNIWKLVYTLDLKNFSNSYVITESTWLKLIL